MRRSVLVSPIALVIAAPLLAQSSGSPTAFRRDPALLMAKEAKFVAAARSSDPALAAALDRAFRTDIIAAMAPVFRRYGYSMDDAADMTAAYWITAWEGANGIIGGDTDPAMARGVRAQIAKALAPGVAGKSDAVKQDIADTMLLQMLIADARMRAAKEAGPEAIRAVSDAIHTEASAILKTDLRAVRMTAKGFVPDKQGISATGADPVTSPRGGGRTAAVAGSYFRATYGMGGAISFEPLVFFANGDYVELDETPLADLDAAADRARAPDRWGRWRKQGTTFLLTDSKGHTNDYALGSGNFFPAFAAAQGPRLSGTYKKTTGGGDYMVGGGVTTLAVNRLTFSADGSFRQGKEAGGIAPNAAIGNSSAAAGRWRIDGSALELAYSDGRRRRLSFLWGATGTPPRPDIGMAFIGGDVFLRDD